MNFDEALTYLGSITSGEIWNSLDSKEDIDYQNIFDSMDIDCQTEEGIREAIQVIKDNFSNYVEFGEEYDQFEELELEPGIMKLYISEDDQVIIIESDGCGEWLELIYYKSYQDAIDHLRKLKE